MTDKYDRIMKLKIFVDSDDDELKNKYKDAVQKHNTKVIEDSEFIDAGFDLYNPEIFGTESNDFYTFKLDYKICCSAKMVTDKVEYNTGFYMYPRSSISKTSLRLANNVGIIDAGYRGHLIAMLDYFNNGRTNGINVEKFERHVQICAPGLVPILVEIVNSKEELGTKTQRGDGGFGSTGI